MTAMQGEQRTIATPPPTVTVVRAMLSNLWIVVLSVVVFVAIGAGAALLRTPTYTAKSRLTVGRINISSPGALSGFAAATQALATGYSRTVTALPVAKAVSAKTGISVKDVQDHVVATPIAESPVFRVEAAAPDQRQAIRLANESSRALIRYTARLNQSNPDTGRLFAAYRGALASRAKARQQLGAAAAAVKAQPIPSTEAELESARGAAEAASLRVNALGRAYTASVQSQTSTQLIQVISPATEATSDRRSTFLIYIFIGLVGGLLVGGAAAFFRESRLLADPAIQ